MTLSFGYDVLLETDAFILQDFKADVPKVDGNS